MNKILSYIILGVLFFSTQSVTAQTSTATPSSTTVPTVKVDKEIQNLKDKVANSVAEMRKDQKAVTGRILSVKGNSLSLKSNSQITYNVEIDNALTKIYQVAGVGRKEIGIEDLEKNNYIIVGGPILDNSITANFIYQDEQFIVGTGQVTEVNKTDFFLKTITSDKDNITLDIETSTKLQILNIKTLEIERSGFTKIKEGDTIHFVYKKTGVETQINRYSALKILIIPQEHFIK